jgi:hypothetical protein
MKLTMNALDTDNGEVLEVKAEDSGQSGQRLQVTFYAPVEAAKEFAVNEKLSVVVTGATHTTSFME